MTTQRIRRASEPQSLKCKIETCRRMAGESFKLVAALAVTVPALLGFVIASYLALYQWGVFSTVWEPFFGAGSRTILNSSVSHLLPIPDAALGALGYFLDALTAVTGGRAQCSMKL